MNLQTSHIAVFNVGEGGGGICITLIRPDPYVCPVHIMVCFMEAFSFVQWAGASVSH